MIARMLSWSIKHRGFMVLVMLAVSMFGVWSFTQQPVDAYPDISSPEVLILTTFPGRAPEEIERQITIPIELAMGSVPNIKDIRSRTIFGLSVVSLVFEDGTDKYFLRQRAQERLSSILLPPGVEPELGPLSTAYGEVYRYVLTSTSNSDVTDLRTINDWVVIPRLQRTPGVAEVINFGGLEKQYTLQLMPRQLERYGMTLADVVDSVSRNNSNAGGSVLRRGEMSFVIRGRGAFRDIHDIESTVVNTIQGTPVYLKDVAFIQLDSAYPSGIFGKDDDPNGVEGIVLMRRGENPSEVLRKLKLEVDELNTSSLPDGVQISAFYDRQVLVSSTLETVSHSVLLGIGLVVLVLLAFVGSPAVALLVGVTVPFSLLFALGLMYLSDIPIGLLSIGAIDFGILVDGAVVMADSIIHKLTQREQSMRPESVRKTVLDAAVTVERPVFFSMLIIVCAYVPLLTLTSIEGLLFRPMALTVIFALVGAVFFALFVLPGLASYLFRNGFTDWESPVFAAMRNAYAMVLAMVLRGRWLIAVMALSLLAAVLTLVVPRLGFDFLPYLDEGVIWVRASFPEGTSLEQTAAFGNNMRQLVREIPEVTFVTSQAGRNDSGTDPFAPSRLEMMVGLKPIKEWSVGTKAELIAQIGSRLRNEYPTTRFNFTQPIIDSVTEDTNGTSANLAIEFSGPDLDILRALGEKTVLMLRDLQGALDVSIEQEALQTQLVIEPDRVKCARYDVSIEDVNRLINTALGGEPIATVYEGERRFAVVARFDRSLLTSPESIGRLPVFTAEKVPIPLSQVARFELKDGQTLIARDGGRRRITVRCDIVGRSQGAFVTEAQQVFKDQIQVPDRYRVRWIGMFENLERAKSHFLLVMPITIGLIYVLLLAAFGSHREALLVLSAVPFAFIGGALGLYFRGMTLNVSSGVGFAALFGVAMMDGVILIEWISSLRATGLPLDTAIVRGTLERFRPILMASMVAILGLVPASLATGLGSDVQRPLATVIVYGLLTAMLLNLLVLPALYRIIARPDGSPAESSADVTLPQAHPMH